MQRAALQGKRSSKALISLPLTCCFSDGAASRVGSPVATNTPCPFDTKLEKGREAEGLEDGREEPWRGRRAILRGLPGAGAGSRGREVVEAADPAAWRVASASGSNPEGAAEGNPSVASGTRSRLTWRTAGGPGRCGPGCQCSP